MEIDRVYLRHLPYAPHIGTCREEPSLACEDGEDGIGMRVQLAQRSNGFRDKVSAKGI